MSFKLNTAKNQNIKLETSKTMVLNTSYVPDEIPVDEFLRLEIITVAVNTSVTIPHINGYVYDYTITYGDGTADGTVTTYNDADCTHIYAIAGTYEIKISGTCETINVANTGTLRNKVYRVISFGTTGLKVFNLYGCLHLYSVPEAGIGFQSLETLNYLFGRTAITEVSKYMFYYATQVTTASYIFEAVAITKAHKGWFWNCPLITAFNESFAESGITSVHADIFKYNSLVTSFSSTFESCKISSIPVGLFRYNPLVTNVSYCFAYNTTLSIITYDIFEYNPLIENMYGLFFLNTHLVTIPSSLFINNLAVTTFYSCFGLCVRLTSMVPLLWNRIPEPTGTQCFFNDLLVTNYSDIPAGWK